MRSRPGRGLSGLYRPRRTRRSIPTAEAESPRHPFAQLSCQVLRLHRDYRRHLGLQFTAVRPSSLGYAPAVRPCGMNADESWQTRHAQAFEPRLRAAGYRAGSSELLSVLPPGRAGIQWLLVGGERADFRAGPYQPRQYVHPNCGPFTVEAFDFLKS